MMKLMMEPGRALVVMPVVAFFARFALRGIPLIGGLLSVILLFAAVFGLVGGLFLMYVTRRQPA
jgi:hypothetical protein